jgi:prepilin-type N-terminal cleavage/methylation domain-containing protein
MNSRKGGMSSMRMGSEESGFTIVELLIATTVFSVVLLIMTFGIIQVTNTFFKGDNNASTQRVATNVLNTLSQAVQFNGGTVAKGANTLCIGGQQFSYWLGYQLESTADPAQDQQTNALVENSGGCTGTASTTGRELLTDNMRLSNLTVTCLSTQALCASTTTGGALYQVDVRIVYGDYDLLYSPSQPHLSLLQGAIQSDAACNGREGGEQFCAVSDISTVVSERI